MTTATALHDQPRTEPRPAPRTLRSDLDALRSRVAAAIAAQPIAAAATAAGVGFVLGAGLARPTIRLLVSAAARTATRSVAARLGEAIRQSFLAHHEAEGRGSAHADTD